MKLTELKVGDVIIADSGFTCLKAGKYRVKVNSTGDLYINCTEGKHFLTGQLDNDDELVGLSR